VRRTGSDVTIVGALQAVEIALEAADALATEGVAAEVVDLRTLRPLDVTTITESVSRTGRLVVVEEGPPTRGYAADVIASAVERVGRWRHDG
jgi:pyruvate dehydrogenase E1 component beta subunit